MDECERVEIPPQVEKLARLAWASVRRKPGILDVMAGDGQPMPPAVALDMVQDETGDRRAAAIALIGVAACEMADGATSVGDLAKYPRGVAADGVGRVSFRDAVDDPLRLTRMARELMLSWGDYPDRFGEDVSLVRYVMRLIAYGPVAFPDPRVCPLGRLESIRQWFHRASETLDTCQLFWAMSE